MKVRFFQVILAILCLVPCVNGFESFVDKIRQGVGAAKETLVSTEDSIDALVQLVEATQKSVNKVSQKVAQLAKTAAGIVSVNPQESIKNSFGTITGGLDTSLDLLPVVQELSGVLSVVGDRLLPVISKYPGVSAGVTNDIAKVTTSIATITAEINRIKAALELWVPKIKDLSTNLGKHAVEMAAQVEGAVADTKKLF